MKFIVLIYVLVLLGCSDFSGDSKVESTKKPRPKVTGNIRTDEFPGAEKLVATKKITCDRPIENLFAAKKKGNYSWPNFLENLVQSYYLSHLKVAFEGARALTLKTDNNCAEWSGLKGTEKQDQFWSELQHLWGESMQAYHRVEPLVIGPASESSFALASDIYSWPSVSSCGVDVQVLKKVGELQANDNTKGYDALEYLVFDQKLKHSCSSRNRQFEALEKWSQQSAKLKRLQRCQYVNKVAEQLAEDLFVLGESWTGNNNELMKAYSKKKESEVLQEIFESLLSFADNQMKDERLGAPSGLSRRLCFKRKCPNKAEHKYSKQSVAALNNNYHGLLDFFVGSSSYEKGPGAVGFYDYLRHKGEKALADTFVQRIYAGYCNTASGLEGADIRSLARKMNVGQCQKTTSEKRLEPLCALYHDSKSISDLIKVDLRVKLSLKQPQQGGGDSD